MESDEQQDFERKSETRGFKPLKRKNDHIKKSVIIAELQGRIASLAEQLKSFQGDEIVERIIGYRMEAYQNILDFINSK